MKDPWQVIFLSATALAVVVILGPKCRTRLFIGKTNKFKHLQIRLTVGVGATVCDVK